MIHHCEVNVEIGLTNLSKSKYCLGNAGQGCKMTLSCLQGFKRYPSHSAITTDRSPHLRLFFIRLPHKMIDIFEEFHLLKMDHGIA